MAAATTTPAGDAHDGPTRRAAILLYPQVAALDVAGPFEALQLVNVLTGTPCYELLSLTLDGAPVTVAGGYQSLVPTHSAATLPAPLDLLVVPGGPGASDAAQDPELLDWLGRAGRDCARLASVCTGAEVLARAGLAGADARLSTHWTRIDALRRSAPDLTVEEDAVYVVSGKLWSSGGMTAGIDMTLAMIEADHGRQVALDVARFLVLARRRDGNQSQFSPQMRTSLGNDPRLDRIQRHIEAEPADDLSIAALARLANMSPRSLQRAFKQASGMTLGDYVLEARLEVARGLLENSHLGVAEIARRAGFGAADNLRRAFRDRFHLTPREFRARPGGPAPP